MNTFGIAAHVTALRADILTAFKARLHRGISEDNLKSDINVPALARYLQAVVQEMSLQARDGASEADLLKIAAIARAELERHNRSPSPGRSRN